MMFSPTIPGFQLLYLFWGCCGGILSDRPSRWVNLFPTSGSVACFNAMLSHCATTKDVQGAEACMEGSLQHFEGSDTCKN